MFLFCFNGCGGVQYADPLYRLPMTFVEIFPVGVLVSRVSVALMRISRLLPAAQPD